jgi:hypothetical protein
MLFPLTCEMVFSYRKRMIKNAKFLTHAELMRAIGGYKAISEQLGEPYPTVSAWAANGIPVRVWTPIITMAKDRGIAIAADDLLVSRPVRAETERRMLAKRSERLARRVAGRAGRAAEAVS